jgi:glutathione synthase/RimK-type ligase-like ATP-grasp enzyme
MAEDRTRVLHISGIDDTDTVTVTYLTSSTDLRLIYDGNVDMLSLLDDREFSVHEIHCGGVPGATITVPDADVVINAICDPDTNTKSLKVVANIQAALDLPTINPPEKVVHTRRDLICDLLAGRPGLRMPRTARIQPPYRSDVLPLAEAAGIHPPFLMRVAGAHGGEKLTLVDEPHKLDELDKFAFDGATFYVTEFADFRSPDGYYRKHRVIFIGGAPFPKHLIASRRWNIHAEDRDELMNLPEFEAEEDRFLREFPSGRDAVFAEVASALDVDYFGMDYGIDAAGDVVVFEANCCFRPAWEGQSESPVSSHRESDARIRAAFAELLRSRAANGARS